MSLLAPASEPRRPALIFIFFTVALDMLALGIIIPILPGLVVQMASGDAVTGARVFGLFGTVWAFMQFIAAPILGSLSDRFGRRPVILLSVLGLSLDYVLMALAPNLTWLLVGRILSGITSANFATAGAYIADVLPPEKRAQGFGMIGVAFGVGFVFGPAIGGLLGESDPRLPFWIAAALSMLNFLYGWVVLPESLPKENRVPFSLRRANPLGSLRLLRQDPILIGMATVSFFSLLGHAVLPSVFVLYADYRYHWGRRMVGLTMAGVGICSALVQGALIGPFVKRFGEKWALVLGLSFGALGFAMYGIAPNGALFALGVPLMALWGLASPAAQGLMSSRVGAEAQGQLQGASGSLMGIAEMIGPGLFTWTFAWSIEPSNSLRLPGAPFFLAAALLVLSLLIAVRVLSGAHGPTAPLHTR